VELLDSPLHNYFKQNDCLNYFFCFRWVLIQFKRSDLWIICSSFSALRIDGCLFNEAAGIPFQCILFFLQLQAWHRGYKTEYFAHIQVKNIFDADTSFGFSTSSI